VQYENQCVQYGQGKCLQYEQACQLRAEVRELSASVQTVPKGARLQEISAGIQEAVSAAVFGNKKEK